MDDPGPTTGGGDDLPNDWDGSYLDTPPWDIGRPQQPFVELAAAGALRGPVLDLGCGTGEHALLAASHGHEATGIDIAPRAVAQARAKAAERGLDTRFLVGDALDADRFGTRFATVLDCGFLHVLPDAGRERLVAVLRQVLLPDGRYHALCFSDLVPGDSGPRRLSRDELTALFNTDGLVVEDVSPSTIEATFLEAPIPAWLASVRRTA